LLRLIRFTRLAHSGILAERGEVRPCRHLPRNGQEMMNVPSPCQETIR
jgi:hypothetical protein